jgi:hypothetical protein
VLAVAAVIPTLLSYRRATAGMRTTDRSILSLTRTAAVALIMLALLQPVLTVTRIVSQRSVVAILLDDSISMRVSDQGSAPRAEFMRTAFHPELGEVSKALSRRLEPRFFKFAGNTLALTPGDGMRFAGAPSPVQRLSMKNSRPTRQPMFPSPPSLSVSRDSPETSK